jgi:predicted DNA-binding transcriptional regulator AlpA
MIKKRQQHTSADAEYVDTEGLEALTGVSSSTWAKRRLSGDTPPFIKIGKSVRYHVPTAKAWLARRTRSSTSDRGDEAA